MIDTSKAITQREVALLALEIAIGYAEAHIKEEGGNNRGDQVEFFQKMMNGAPGDPWCADFVGTCLTKGYARRRGWVEDREHLPRYVKDAGALLMPLSGYCPALAEAARERYMFHSKAFTPASGDLVLFDFKGQNEPHHVGFVRHVTRGGMVTLEGNTSSGGTGSQADGDGVFKRLRTTQFVYGYVHFS